MTKIIEIRQKIKLSGHLMVYDDTGKILIDTPNLITNTGASMIAQGYGPRKYIKYLGLGKGTIAAAREDVSLGMEFTRYDITNAETIEGNCIITTNIEDNYSLKIEEWGLFMDEIGKVSSTIKTGLLFARVVYPLLRKYKQKLMVEWRISLS